MAISVSRQRNVGRRHVALLFGVMAAALYAAIVEIGAELTPGYSQIEQPVSSLYQAGASLGLPIALAFVVYNVLVATFGFGVWRAAAAWHGRRRAGIAAGLAIVLVGIAGAIDDVFPQDPIGAAITTVGTLHIAFAGIASLLTVIAMASAAWWLLGIRSLRPLAFYSVASFVVILAFGPITAAATASSSPIMGLLERVTIFTFTLWMAVMSVALTRAALRSPVAA